MLPQTARSCVGRNVRFGKAMHTQAKRCREIAEDLKNGYLDDGVASRSRFDGPSAALGFIVGSVVRFGLHLYLQLVLTKLARQRPVQGRQ